MRIERQHMNITDLFMVTHAPTEHYEGDGFIETRFGKLRVFWRNDMPKDKLAQILHLTKFRYPVKGQALEIANMTTNERHIKHELPKTTAVEHKARTEFSEEVKNDAAQVFDELKREGFTKSAYDANGDLVN